MREIEERIAAWRGEIATDGSINEASARELESHLRDAIEHEMGGGADAGEAFDLAVARLGTVDALVEEFEKVYPESSWARRVLWMVAGYGTVTLLVTLIGGLRNSVIAWSTRLFPDWSLELPGTRVDEGGRDCQE